MTFDNIVARLASPVHKTVQRTFRPCTLGGSRLLEIIELKWKRSRIWDHNKCTVHQEPVRQKLTFIWAYIFSKLRVHSNLLLCSNVPNFHDIVDSAHQEAIRQKVASIWAYICAVYIEYICLYVQYIKNQAFKKWLPFDVICAAYLKYTVTYNCVWLSPIFMTLYVQYTKNPAVKKWLPFELIWAVYLECIVTSNCVWSYSILLILYVQYTKNPAVNKWLPFELAYMYSILIVHSNL